MMEQIIKSPYDTRDYAVTKLDNGISSLFVSDTMTTTSHVAIIVNAGFMMDGNVCGLAHFLEHMLFMGTKKYPDVADYMNYITSHGGNTNAFTTSVNTCYFFSIDSEYLEGAVDRMAQFFIEPLFKENTVSKEINAVNSEFNETKSNFLYITVQMLKQLVETTHPFHKFDIGSTETLSVPNIREELVNFYNKYYIANNMKLIIMDKRPIGEIQKIAHVFNDIKQKNIQLPIFDNPIRPHRQLKFVRPVSKNGGFNSNDVWIYWTIPNKNTIEHKSMIKYITYLLRKENDFSLISYLRSHGLINSLGFYNVYNLKEYYLMCMTINVTTYGMHHIDALIKIIHKYIKELISNNDMQNNISKYNKCQSIVHKFSEKKELSELLDEILGVTCENGLELPIAIKYDMLPCYYDNNICLDILNYMSIDNANIVMASQLFTGTLKEEYELYGIKYDITNFQYTTTFDINIDDVISGVYIFNDDFIPTQLTVYANKETFEQPIKINANELWYSYKKITLPKACVIIEIMCPNIYKTIKSYVMANILLCHIIRLINGQLYDTYLLGTTYDISLNRDVIHIEIYGFNEKLQYYCREIMHKIQKFFYTDISQNFMNDNEFLIAKNIYGTNIEFARQRRISDQLHDFIAVGIFEKTYSMREILKEFNSISYRDMANVDLYECSNIKCFVSGNILKQNVVHIYDTLSVIDIKTNIESNNWLINISPHTSAQTVESLTPTRIFRDTHNIKYVDIGNVTASDQNNMCCVVVCLGEFQKTNPEYEKYVALNMLFNSMFHTDFFTSLRSYQQLGYTVKCIPREFGRNNVLITQTFSIVSQKYPSHVIEQRIFEYFNDAYKKIIKMIPYMLKEYIDSCIVLLNDLPTNIMNYSIDEFEHISSESYKFDHRKRVINELQNINIDSLRKNYEKIFMSEYSQKIVIYGK
jgi:insulysin